MADTGRRASQVVLMFRHVSVQSSILLWRLLWAILCILWQVVRCLSIQVFSLIAASSQPKPVSDKSRNDKSFLAAAGERLLESQQSTMQNEAESDMKDAVGEVTGKEASAAEDTAVEQSSDAVVGEDLVLRCLRLPASDFTAEAAGSACRKLKEAVAQVRAAGHRDVRFSVQVGSEQRASVAVLGPASCVKDACNALAGQVRLDTQERVVDNFFLVHFTMRESWDLPQDDELVEASIANDWVDLGLEGVGDKPSEESQDGCIEDGTASPRSPQAVLRNRLSEVFLDRHDAYIFMDDNPFASSHQKSVRIDFAGALPDAWDAVSRVILACEARGVYLSHRFEVLLWCPQDLRECIENQVESALSHCQGAPVRISRGQGFGLAGCDLPGFEDLSDNVSAVLSGHAPPGWHRMEWTPDGAGGVPHLTY